MYTVAAFRKLIKQALDEAERGEEVAISRHGSRFLVTVSGELPRKDVHTAVETVEEPEQQEAAPQEQDVTIHLRPKKNSLLRNFDTVCPEHAIPLDWRGKCLQRGCKYGYE